jgi:putative hydrolase of the HAD superfamily
MRSRLARLHEARSQMCQHASDALGLAPERCLLVDDDPELVRATVALGYQGCVVARDGLPATGAQSVVDLRGLLSMVG